ncbi:MAG: hypothetical protein COU63_04190 [Candidatus Pacebacteria bacterium CG10_big_fil_rev_8_21_14_0_10_36_11]|nr:hypothetical protein [Candidatus Pacearchaeota archaeon]OIP74095.1 MAG: hypothetical protein AUK08_02465 [Candidatus Pacebacteria bacterium CG2_30_36_39]PIR64462.1 MAG: hypothetical protein COU63_04190 [Candidatus Pacebacteria bacterium CG10_big_fil_rev_8_21_14_0_10_36_11]PJC42717.1 MAG: hypothetical protein CO040_03075 [Candidatus Pacebacteria bacterium CG_4_9_14_0_2_um_filter_36_8]
MNNQTFLEIQELLALATGHNSQEIMPITQLEVDLGIDMEEDFPRLLAVINQKFDIDLELDHVLDELDEAGDTVEHLVKLIFEEVELG